MSFTNTFCMLPLCRAHHCRAVWTAASAPPGRATPICSGERRSRAELAVSWQRHLPTSLRRVSPTATGRRPPPAALGESHQRGSGKVGGRFWRCLAAGEEVHQAAELGRHLVPVSCGLQGVLEVLRSEAGGARGGPAREGAHLTGHRGGVHLQGGSGVDRREAGWVHRPLAAGVLAAHLVDHGRCWVHRRLRGQGGAALGVLPVGG